MNHQNLICMSNLILLWLLSEGRGAISNHSLLFCQFNKAKKGRPESYQDETFFCYVFPNHPHYHNFLVTHQDTVLDKVSVSADFAAVRLNFLDKIRFNAVFSIKFHTSPVSVLYRTLGFLSHSAVLSAPKNRTMDWKYSLYSFPKEI